MLAFGREVRVSRRRRGLTQQALAERIGISRSALSSIELGKNTGVKVSTWVALGTALGRSLHAALARDAAEEPVDAGHLVIQELVLRLGRPGGYSGRFELSTRPSDPSRSTDVNLLDRVGRRMILVECWNSFGDLGAAARSSARKLAEAQAFAIAHGGDDGPLAVGACWVVRATARNRELVRRYPHIFDAHLPGSSRAWVAALTEGRAIPAEAGFVWCDAAATRLYARRR